MSSAASMIQRNIGRFIVEKNRVPPSITYSEEQSIYEDNMDLDKVDEVSLYDVQDRQSDGFRCQDPQI